MNATVVDVLRALGYPLGVIITLVVLVYVARQLLLKLLESLVARDLEKIRKDNSESLLEVQKQHNLELESRKAELSQETERLKGTLSVELETRMLAARKRFESLLDLWQSSESLLIATDFHDPESIKNSLSQVDAALSRLRSYSVLLSREMLDTVKEYLEETAKVLSTSEEDLDKKSSDPSKDKRIEQLVSGALLAAGLSTLSPATVVAAAPLATALSGFIVPSLKKGLENLRYARAHRARAKLEEAIRKEFRPPVVDGTAL